MNYFSFCFLKSAQAHLRVVFLRQHAENRFHPGLSHYLKPPMTLSEAAQKTWDLEKWKLPCGRGFISPSKSLNPNPKYPSLTADLYASFHKKTRFHSSVTKMVVIGPRICSKFHTKLCPTDTRKRKRSTRVRHSPSIFPLVLIGAWQDTCCYGPHFTDEAQPGRTVP